MKKVRFSLLMPAFILLVIFLVIPLVSLFLPTLEKTVNPFVAYSQFFANAFQVKIFMRTLRVATIVTLVCVLLGIPTAYFISGVSSKWKGILMALTLFPMLTNSVVRSFAWINILGQNGVVNHLLLSLHVIEKPLTLLYTEFSVIIGSIYLFLPTMIISLVGVMDHIEGEVVEAAATLGASRLKTFFSVIVPLSLPGTIVGSILVFTGTLTAYTTPQLLGGNKNMMLSTFLQQNAITLGNWQSSSVVAFIMIVVTLIVMKGLNWIAARLDKRIEVEQ